VSKHIALAQTATKDKGSFKIRIDRTGIASFCCRKQFGPCACTADICATSEGFLGLWTLHSM